MITSRCGRLIHLDKAWIHSDPWGAYRLVLLAARFDMAIATDTVELIKSVDFTRLDKGHIFPELSKLLLSERPSQGLRYMFRCGILKQVHPLLFALVGCRQEESHQPEGDAFQHTLLVVEQCRKRLQDSAHPLVLMWAALLHDIGKPATTAYHKGKLTAYGHDVAGSRLAVSFLTELKAPPEVVNAVQQLVREHMQPVLLYKQKDKVSDRAIRRLLARVDIKELLLLSEADYTGRGITRDYQPIKNWLCRRIEQLQMPGADKS